MKFICFAALLALAAPAAAQDLKAEKRNADYYNVWAIDFKEGKADDAQKIIDDYFVRADQRTGGTGPDIVLNMMTGEWDMLVAWRMKGGMADAEWSMSEDDVKWMQAMAELAGGREAAMAKIDEFDSYIARRASHIAYMAK